MIKNLAFLFLITCLVVGCGKREEAAFQGVEANKDYIAKGFELLQKSDVPNAIRNFDQAIKQDPKDPKNYLVLGQVYMQLKNFSAAASTLSAATRIDPSNAEAFYLLAWAQGLNGDRDKAVASAKKSADLFVLQKDEVKFKRALSLVGSLMQKGEISETMADAKGSVEELKGQVSDISTISKDIPTLDIDADKVLGSLPTYNSGE